MKKMYSLLWDTVCFKTEKMILLNSQMCLFFSANCTDGLKWEYFEKWCVQILLQSSEKGLSDLEYTHKCQKNIKFFNADYLSAPN